MSNTISRINSVLKTKEDLQSFVLVALVLFILVVKCYMLIAEPKIINKQANNISIAKT